MAINIRLRQHGRIIGVLVMTAGVGLFGTLSGFLANMFLAPPKKKEEEEKRTEATADDPKARMAELKRLIETHRKPPWPIYVPS